MKKSIFCLVLSLLLFSSSLFVFYGCEEKEIPPDPASYTRVVLLGGQSNMLGCARNDLLTDERIGAERNSILHSTFENVKIVAEHDRELTAVPEFTSVKLGVGSYFFEGFGPEIGIAEELSKCEGTTYLIKCSFSGTSIFNDWQSPSMLGTEKGSEKYEKFVNFVDTNLKKLEDAGLNPKIVGFCWMQGEADAANEYGAKNYGNNLAKLVGDIRARFNSKSINGQLHFIDATISKIWPLYEMVNNFKLQFSKQSSRNHLIDTLQKGLMEPDHDGLFTDREPSVGETEIDILHYDTTSMLKLGNMFAEQIRQIAGI